MPLPYVPIPVPGLIEAGNVNLNHRPIVNNPDGSVSTVRSVSVGIDGMEVLLPTITPDGKNLSVEEAIARFKRTGEHLGKFNSPDAATVYAQMLHRQQARDVESAAY